MRMCSEPARIAREKKTVAVMVRIFCRGQHAPDQGICAECEELLDYAQRRLDHCPFGGEKCACADCHIHCYKPEMRERVRAVMRYAGPKMLLRHPILAIWHLIDSRKKA